MKPLFVLVLGLQASSGTDRWFGADKAKHLFLGAFVQSAAFSTLRTAGLDKSPAIGAASAATAAATIWKEVRDRGGKGTPSRKDVVWSLAGAAAISPVLLRTK